jgi:hypothetical protein
MSTEITVAGDGILSAKITGMLTYAELQALQKAASDLVNQQGQRSKVRILVVTEDFQGWQRGDNWGSSSFQLDRDGQIERMAIVGDKKWEDLTLIFAAQGLRKFPIEYFEPAEMAKARAWLSETPK